MSELEEFSNLVSKIREEADLIGLYLMGAIVQSSAPVEGNETIEDVMGMMQDGQEFMIQASFQIGDVAWRERVQDPVTHYEMREFNLAAPTEEELLLQQIQDEIEAGTLLDPDAHGGYDE